MNTKDKTQLTNEISNPLTILGQAIEKTADHLHIDINELRLWLDEQVAPLYTQLQLLRLADKYELDPLSDEVGIFEHDNHTQGAYITIDGWSKLINQHPQYVGMSLRESSESTANIPNWMECTIYRNDRILPIVVKEYLEEVRTQHPSWEKMPRRMLRHRVIQQCARLALGISAPEAKIESNEKVNIKQPTPNEMKLSRSDYLKEQLRVNNNQARKSEPT